MKEAWAHLIGGTLDFTGADPAPVTGGGDLDVEEIKIGRAVTLLRHKVRPKRQRKPSIARIAQQANKTGNPIEIKPDGSLVVMPKPTDQVGNTNLNEWDREYGTD